MPSLPVIRSRARVGLFATALLVLLMWKPWLHWVIYVIVGLLAFFGTREFHRMAGAQDLRISLPFAAAGALGLVAAGIAPLHVFTGTVVIILVALLLGSFIVHMLLHGYDAALRSVPAALFAALYVGLPLGMTLQVLEYDRVFLMFGLALIWLSDTGAYYAGSRWGKHKMAPNLSPKKTWEGAVGGIVACLLVGIIFKSIVPDIAFEYTWTEVLLVGTMVGVLAPLGDLAESVLKRDSGRKDSGRAMGGHGGVLDRIDSLLFCAPAFYLFLMVTGRV